MTFMELALARYSVRQYKETPVEKEKLGLILEAGRIAPTAGNRQPHRIFVAQDAEVLEKLDACTRSRNGAPLVLVVCYDKEACWVRPFDGENSGQVDASIVTTHMMLQAQELGLGSLWVMHFDPKATSEQLGLAEGLVPVAMLMVGYRADDSVPTERHSARQTIEEMLI